MEKFYITTSIPYLNASPHLGFALEAVQADAIARHRRLRGDDVFFLTGSDEHGAKISKAAEKAGKGPKEFVDEKVLEFQKLLSELGVSYDDFIRTSDKNRHWPGAEALWRKLAEAGDIYKNKYKGFYCEGCEAFITDKDLDEGLCGVHKTEPEVIEEENYFFKLSKYAPKIKDAILREELKILPESRKNESLNVLSEIGDISFSRPSRDLPWGVPVPQDATQTMYVWCDALSNYISALGYGQKGFKIQDSRFKKWWPADIHVIGKDILKFHAVFWPAMLMSAGLPLPKVIFVHGFINVKGEKMSKSRGNVADPFPLLQKYGKDAVRFYLLREVPTLGDGDFSEEHFAKVYQGALVNGLGNLLSRTLKMMQSLGEIKKPSAEELTRFPVKKNINLLGIQQSRLSVEDLTPPFLVDNFLWAAYKESMEKYELGRAIQGVWSFLKRLDEYIEENKPYKLTEDAPEEAKIILWHIAYSLASLAWMIKPFMPDTAEKILVSLGADHGSTEPWTKFSAKEIPHLFPKVEK